MADDITLTLSSGVPPPRKIYEVTSEAGLFKAGKQHNKGERIELDIKAAANFIAAGDIKEVGDE